MFSIADLSVSIGPVPIVRNASLRLNEGEMCGQADEIAVR